MAHTAFLALPRLSAPLSRRLWRLVTAGALLLIAQPVADLIGMPSSTVPAPAYASHTMSSDLRSHTLVPPGRPFLSCRFQAPADFVAAQLPEEDVDLENLRRFLPLGVMIANYGPVVFTVSARPAYSDGNVAQWLEYLAQEEGFDAGAIEAVQIGVLRGVCCDALQQGEGLTMRMRLVLIENGGRLFNLTAMAPVQLWSAAADGRARMIHSFEIVEDGGQSVALGIEAQGARGGDKGPGANSAMSTTAATAEPASTPHAAAENSAPSPQETLLLEPQEWAELVLAADDSATNLEHPINQNLRDRGVGLMPNLLSCDDDRKAVTVGAGAVEASFEIPYGWHVIDDGRRTLVFDGGGRMQINLDLRPTDATPEAFAASLLEDYIEKQPELETVHALTDGIAIAAARGLQIDGEMLDQAFMVRDVGRRGMLLVVRATGNSDDIRLAMNLAGDLILRLQPADILATR